jgi:hypothetical protein
MSQYTVRPMELTAYAKHESLLMIASFDAKADVAARQRTIDYLVGIHGIVLTNTKTLRYDPALLTKDGENKLGNIRIGPKAFAQDHSWLANIIFHESIHSDQFAFYAKHSIDLNNYPKDSEPVRVLIALDELEAFYWSWRNATILNVSKSQMAEMEREVRLWQINVDDAETLKLARALKYNDARLALFKRLKP